MNTSSSRSTLGGTRLLSLALRDATTSLHEATEALPALARLLGDDLAEADYRLTQARFFGVYAPLEGSVATSPLWPSIDTDPPARAESLQRDLRGLGLEPRDLPRAEVEPAVDRAVALGRAYVLEGSALGARALHRHLARHRWFDAGRNARFFGDLAPHARWQRFRSALDALEVGAEERAEALRAARDTFQTIHDWMARA